MFSSYQPPSESTLKSRRGAFDYTGLSEEDQQAYDDIMELLLTGGYFRARIQGLSSFDKITGGMSWSITAANEGEELDVDVFFKEESSLGERLAISESICKALIKMKCPEKIEPHQIQGGKNFQDYQAILKVIRWLIKKVLETRKETGDLMKKFSNLQFNKERLTPEDVEFEKVKAPAFEFNRTVTHRYRPERGVKRKGRRVSYLNSRSEEDNIASCLLEYGEYYAVTEQQQGSSSKSKLAQKLEKTLEANTGPSEQDQRRRQQLESEMMGTGELDEELAKKFILGENLSELENQFDTEDITGQKSNFSQQSHESQVTRLTKQIEKELRDLEELKSLFQTTQTELEEVQLEYNKRQSYNQKIREALQKFDEMVTPENQKQLKMLKSLVGE